MAPDVQESPFVKQLASSGKFWASIYRYLAFLTGLAVLLFTSRMTTFYDVAYMPNYCSVNFFLGVLYLSHMEARREPFPCQIIPIRPFYGI